jgi:hypothetical protein
MKKVKVLVFAANPSGTDPLDLHREFREIDEQIRLAEFRDAVDLIIVPGTRLVDLLRKLNEVRPDIVHFSGHGDIDEAIVLESWEEGHIAPDDTSSPVRDLRRSEPVHEARQVCAPRPLSKSALLDVVKACDQGNIRVVVLNACHTRPLAEALCEVIDCAISMNRAITDARAIRFAASFYGALAFGLSVQKAFDQGMARVYPKTDIPELIVRPGVDASTLVLVGPRENRPLPTDVGCGDPAMLATVDFVKELSGLIGIALPNFARAEMYLSSLAQQEQRIKQSEYLECLSETLAAMAKAIQEGKDSSKFVGELDFHLDHIEDVLRLGDPDWLMCLSDDTVLRLKKRLDGALRQAQSGELTATGSTCPSGEASTRRKLARELSHASGVFHGAAVALKGTDRELGSSNRARSSSSRPQGG